jgi:chemotaxis protein MotB
MARAQDSLTELLKEHPVAGIPKRRAWPRWLAVFVLLLVAAGGVVASYQLYKRVRFLEGALAGTYANLEAIRTRATAAELQARDRQAELERRAAALTGERDQLAAELAPIRRRATEADTLAARLGSLVVPPQGDVRAEQGRVVLRFAENALFAPGRAELAPTVVALLARIAEALRAVPDRKIWVQAYATATTPTGAGAGAGTAPAASGWDISTARATAIVRYLQDQGRLPPERLAAVGFGVPQPVPPSDAMGTGRTEIVLLP